MLKNGGYKVLWKTKEGEIVPVVVGLHMKECFLEKVTFKLVLKDGPISTHDSAIWNHVIVCFFTFY